MPFDAEDCRVNRHRRHRRRSSREAAGASASTPEPGLRLPPAPSRRQPARPALQYAAIVAVLMAGADGLARRLGLPFRLQGEVSAAHQVVFELAM
ncbi:hypothetical protein QZN04_09665, partial [Burkholderia gladioli]|nr:hypothetical protein [Burkholderia gladioli]